MGRRLVYSSSQGVRSVTRRGGGGIWDLLVPAQRTHDAIYAMVFHCLDKKFLDYRISLASCTD